MMVEFSRVCVSQGVGLPAHASLKLPGVRLRVMQIALRCTSECVCFSDERMMRSIRGLNGLIKRVVSDETDILPWLDTGV
jgi:hypothetical protein